ncbi:MAG: deoxyguanosinetriphosphate triphosphohydrolase [Candidatus Azobacteroides sp.]|nr:deoxyguanosinetriphosphate triphosphohydrolase [Candidatus Azobacteroides sp.]
MSQSDWHRLLSSKRFGLEEFHDHRKDGRTEFQRDYDRLIFSAPFRRLQNKTQVFPLPGSIFVHNRLTHSLEVSSVGRSLATNIARQLELKYQKENLPGYFSEIGSIVAAGCLAHDMGNPPFGHSGEKAIATYFSEGKGKVLREKFSEAQWNDFISFEGNANAFRLLTHQFNGRRQGGFVLTYATLASIVKYPYSSAHSGGKQKFGFFLSERESFARIADDMGLMRLTDDPPKYARHPLVYPVEAADDICYQIMDLEDAYKLKLLSTEEVKQLLLGFFPEEKHSRIQETMNLVTDVNEQIAYLRSRIIGILIDECADVFVKNETLILAGKFQGCLMDYISPEIAEAYNACSKTAFKKIYKSPDVLEIELAGYQIISTLLDKLIDAVLYPEKAYSKLLLNRIPEQYEINSDDPYIQVQSVLDFVSGMTDLYALDLYRKITGMSLPAL